MDELTFLVSVYLSALAIGWSFGFKWLVYKKAMESVVSTS